MDQDLRPPTLRNAVHSFAKIGHVLHSRCTAQGGRHNVAGIGPESHHHRSRQPDHSAIPGEVAKANPALQKHASFNPSPIRTVCSDPWHLMGRTAKHGPTNKFTSQCRERAESV